MKAAAVAVMAHEPAAEPGGVYEHRQDSVFGRGGDVFGGGRRRAIAGVGPDARGPAVAAVCGTAHRHRRRVARRAGGRVVDFAGPVGCVPVQDRVLSPCASSRASGSTNGDDRHQTSGSQACNYTSVIHPPVIHSLWTIVSWVDGAGLQVGSMGVTRSMSSWQCRGGSGSSWGATVMRTSAPQIRQA